MTITYYTVETRNGLPTPAQARKLGTPDFGYRTLGIALRYCPPGGVVIERHTDGANDWSGRDVAGREVNGAPYRLP